MSPTRRFASLAITAIVVAACTGATPSAAPTSGATGPAATTAITAAPTAGYPDKLVIGFVPSTEANALVESIKPLADYLTGQLGISVTGFVSNDYTGLVTAMETGQAQIGALPPYGMVQAIDRAKAEVILQSQRFGSGTYHTQFFTNAPDKYCTISPAVENARVVNDADVQYLNCNGTARANADTPEGPVGTDTLKTIAAGTTFSFVEETSSSGYIFPATVLINSGIDPQKDIAPIFAGSHNASVIAVCGGDAEVGVSFDDARPSTTSDCNIAKKVVVFAYGPEIPNDGIAVSGDVPAGLRAAIKAALIAYAETEDGKKVLNDIYQITAFTDPNIDALQIIRDAVEKLGYSG